MSLLTRTLLSSMLVLGPSAAYADGCTLACASTHLNCLTQAKGDRNKIHACDIAWVNCVDNCTGGDGGHVNATILRKLLETK